MGQMNVSVTDRLAGFVRKKVRTGQYNSASEVVREALRRMEEEDARALRLAKPAAEDILADLDAEQLDGIRRRVRAGIDDIAAGRFAEIENAERLSTFADHIKTEGRKFLDSQVLIGSSLPVKSRPAKSRG
jgi:antitoxin ParD1/3/4